VDQPKIELRKIRDFGENLNDTFVFLKQNLKPLLAAYLAIVGIFMIAQAIANGMYQSQSFGVFDKIRKGLPENSNTFDNIISVEYFLYVILSWLTLVIAKVLVSVYIKFYLENNGAKPSIEDIWVLFKRYIFKVLIFSIPILLLIAIGTVFCVLPGIYLLVVFVPFHFILVIEDETMGGAFNRCFELIKENFWISFATYLVAYMIYSFSGMIIGVVVGVVVGVITYLSTDSIGTTAGLVSSFLNIFTLVFYIIFLVSACLHYFNLVEIRDGAGILQRIQTIGEQPGNFDNTQEQY
jgi:hypothetical protein